MQLCVCNCIYICMSYVEVSTSFWVRIQQNS
eukprot:COSAG02_NODE_17246_length_1018_cov_1.376496_2_plen_30_part_01